MSSSRKLETFFPQAPARNMSAVMRDVSTPGKELLGGAGKPLPSYKIGDAERKLDKFREEYRAARAVPIEEIAELEVESREELILEAAVLFANHAVPKVEDKETMVHASLAGCAVIMAFLELTARMHAERGLDVSGNDEYRRVINKSQVTLLKLAATSRDADGVFMTNASTWTKREIDRMDDKALSIGLHFDESYFELTDEDVVAIKNDAETRKRAGKQAGRSFDFSPQNQEILFGCPHRSGIGRLYGAMLNAAIRNRLLEDSREGPNGNRDSLESYS